MEWIDISVPIRPGMISFPGDPVVLMDRPIAIADGAVCNVSRLDFGVHSGTHVDAPVHFMEGAPGVEGMAIESLVGPAWVVDATNQVGNIDIGHLDALDIPAGARRVLFNTPNSRLWEVPTFSPNYVALTPEAAAADRTHGAEEDLAAGERSQGDPTEQRGQDQRDQSHPHAFEKGPWLRRLHGRSSGPRSTGFSGGIGYVGGWSARHRPNVSK